MTRQRRLHKRMDDLFPQQSDQLCRVCNEPVVDGRWNYCSERCRDVAQAVQKMFSWQSVRERILERDDHTCQHCGLSKEMGVRAYWQVEELVDDKRQHLRQENVDAWRDLGQRLRERYDVRYPKFEVDHIQPISEGGHPFDESNLQTLCVHCHEEKTAGENSVGHESRPEVGLDAYLADGGFTCGDEVRPESGGVGE